jgi:SET domain-containing protein
VTTKFTIRTSHRGGDAGRGAFATQSISVGELLLESHVVVVPKADLAVLESTILGHYYFAWGDHFQDGAIALSVGSLLNHNDDPNTRFERDQENAIIRFYAARDIRVDEEITISYRTAFPEEPLWFDAK